MSATGYADTQPVVPNDSPAHQAQNRRVELVVLSTLLDDSAATPTAAGSASTVVAPAGGNP